ncbi:M50 family metallopeptidase [Bacillus sp. SM2101]|uniref:M50 family metallopeptidase n=1 Tax=Bacillus sp. SM2101 TaxID=2805366 RepID=UPI001BDF4D58|nr:M50 family metallopeptidase [Bacillus sp. SM2101]
MDGYIQFAVIFLLFITLILPFTTFIHELGHALPALLISKDPVEIRLGKSDKGTGITFGRLTIKIQPLSGWLGFAFFHIPKHKSMSVHHALVLLSGPLFSFMLSLFCYVLYTFLDFNSISSFLIKSIMHASLGQFILTIFPIKYPSFLWGYGGMPSDGYRVLKLLMNRG